jgi:hypothetical protein
MTATANRTSSAIRTSPGFFANSIIAAALGVSLAHVFSLFALAVVAAFAGRDPVMTSTSVTMRADGSDVVMIAQPLASLVLGFILLMMFPGSKDRSSGRLVMLWTMLFAFRNAAWAMIETMFNDDSPIALALGAWEVPSGLDLVIAIVGGLGLILVAVGAAAAFLSFSRHRSEVVNARERLRFTGFIALLPGLAGPLVAIVMFLGDEGDGFISALPLAGIFVVVTVLAAAFTKSFAPPQVIEERTLSVGLVAAFALVVLVVRFGLGPGVPIPPWDDALQLTWRP